MSTKSLFSVIVLSLLCFAVIPAPSALLSGETKEPDIVVAPPPPPLAVFDLPTLSLAFTGEEPHFLKMTLALGYEKNSGLAKELSSRKGQLLHIIRVLAGGKKFSDLDTIQKKLEFVEEIKAHVNTVLMNGKIKEVYIKEFILN